MNEAEAKSATPAKKPQAKKGGRSFWKELPVLIVVALFLTLVIKTYAIQAFYIPSGSMQNTLAIGDRVLVDKLSFEFGNVHRGDIVVFSGDGTWDPGVTPASTNFFSRFGQSVASMFGFASCRATAPPIISSASSACPATRWPAATLRAGSPSTAWP